MTSGSTSFSSLDGIGSNIHVVGLVDLTSSGGQSTQIKYLSKSTDTYNKILLH